MIDFFFDFETRSRLTLSAVGAVKYAKDPSTEPTLLTYAFGAHSPVNYWRLGQPIPNDILEVAMYPERYNFIAHNALFDILIWNEQFTRRHIALAKHPPLSNITDNMALTNHYRVGAKLDTAAMILKMSYKKDKEGRRIMLKQCKPKADGTFPELTEDEWDKFIYYGIVDTRLLRDTYYQCPPLPPQERWAFEWTFHRNLVGIRVDMDLVRTLDTIINREMPGVEAEFSHLVNNAFTIRSPKAKDWFKIYYPEIEDLREDTRRDMLASGAPVPLHVRRALELKDLAGSTSLAKVRKALDINIDGRIYQVLNYHLAQTKRWAGVGIQIQNFPRVVDKKHRDLEGIDLNSEYLAWQVQQKYPFVKDPFAFVKNLLRRFWLPDVGKKFYCGDFSKIEPTVLFWLVGLGPIPDLWYEDMASAIYGLPIDQIGDDSEERTVGKSTNLGAGYGMGKDKFKADTLKKTGILLSDDMADRSIKTYRRKYWQVPRFWKELEYAFRNAIMGQATALCNGKVHVMPMTHHRGVRIRIPSGSYLYYHGATIRGRDLCYVSDEGGRPVLKHLYGGLLCEHVCSSTARDILVPSMWHLESGGFEVMNLVHDEVWAQAEEGRDDEFERLMTIVPNWCADLKITIGAKHGVRYLK